MLTESNIMLTALRVSEAGPSVPRDCVDRLLSNLREAGLSGGPDAGSLEDRVAKAYQDLSIAGLLDPDEEGRCSLTPRGRRILQEHSATGVDDSVLEQFPEYIAYLREQGRPKATDDEFSIIEPKRAYFEGRSAYRAGRGLADNPYGPDSISRLEWENGWSEGREEAAKTAGPPREEASDGDGE